MKRNRIYILLSILLLGLNLSGCINFIPDLSEEEEQVVIRYMADAVVENNAGYEASLMSEDEKAAALLDEEIKAKELEKIVEKESKDKEEKKENNTPDDIKTDIVAKVYDISDIAEFLDLNGVDFEYTGYEILDKYPNSDEIGTLVYKPEKGKVLVVKLNVCNVSGEKQTINLNDTDVRIKAIINDDIVVNSINQSLFLESFDNFIEDMDKEQVKESVMIFEIEEPVDITTLKLQLKNKSKETIKISLQ